jgi:hypothetical protein
LELESPVKSGKPATLEFPVSPVSYGGAKTKAETAGTTRMLSPASLAICDSWLPRPQADRLSLHEFPEAKDFDTDKGMFHVVSATARKTLHSHPELFSMDSCCKCSRCDSGQGARSCYSDCTVLLIRQRTSACQHGSDLGVCLSTQCET